MKNRRPITFFRFSGAGGSSITHHAGAYHFALYESKISDYNIISYSSVLNKKATEITYDYATENKMLPEFGDELFVIMCEAKGEANDKLLAGVMWGWLKDHLGNKIGGLAVELPDKNISKDELLKKLHVTIDELHQGTYNQYYLTEIDYIIKEYTGTEKYNSCICGLAFVEFENQ